MDATVAFWPRRTWTGSIGRLWGWRESGRPAGEFTSGSAVAVPETTLVERDYDLNPRAYMSALPDAGTEPAVDLASLRAELADLRERAEEIDRRAVELLEELTSWRR